jgi:hypothetical protein
MDITLPPPRNSDPAAANLAADLAARDRWLVESYAQAAAGPDRDAPEMAAPEIVVEEGLPTHTLPVGINNGAGEAGPAGHPLSGPHRPPGVAYDDLGLIVPKRKKA